ncbi:MAG: L-asparaginase 2 [Muribaculaceae bacterium]|nr:L-asparaginase 2 [Muribaculaceae bacterium]
MKRLKSLGLLAVIVLTTVMSAFAEHKSNVYILATGGTIAGTGASATSSGYTAGQVAIQTLIDAVPQMSDLANITGEQVVNIGSQDMNNEVWLILAKRINELLESDDVDGIVITHGTDTMEETAYFLNLTVKSHKPVVLTGSMRPSTALSADGPLNLYNAVATAADPSSKHRGVMIVMNGLILGAHGTQKMNTLSVQTFQDPDGGPLGYVYNSKPYWNLSTLKKHTTESVFDVRGLDKLPKVGIVYSYSNIDADVMTPFLDKANGYDGIVHAGVGNGNFHKNIFPSLLEARKNGILVVRSSRLPTGPTTLYDEVDDEKYELVASWELNPQKARVLLMLALTKTHDWKTIQKYFEEY